MKNSKKIVIIGAGLAGLTAALRLSQKNYEVEVFEARSRVGGRVFTTYLEDDEGRCSIVEMGGHNILDGGEAIFLLNLLKELNLTIEHKTIKLALLVSKNDKYIKFQDLLLEQNFSKNSTDDKVDAIAKNCSSIAEVLDKLIEDEVLKKSIEARLVGYEGVAIKNQSIYHNLDTLKCILKNGIALAHQSIDSDINHILFNTVQGGNAKLPLKIAEILGDRIHCNKIVTDVSQDNNQIRLNFVDGSIVDCDKLLIATPASVYSDIKFDDKIIPIELLQKISNIQYGKNYKILIPIKNNTAFVQKGIITESQNFFFHDDEKFVTMFCNNDLFCFDEEIQNLKNKFKKLTISNELPREASDRQFSSYRNTITHRWDDDPYAKGSYSGYDIHLAEALKNQVMYHNISVKEVFKPIDDRIFFIGEHTTTLDIIGTMEAAVESAERITSIF